MSAWRASAQILRCPRPGKRSAIATPVARRGAPRPRPRPAHGAAPCCCRACRRRLAAPSGMPTSRQNLAVGIPLSTRTTSRSGWLEAAALCHEPAARRAPHRAPASTQRPPPRAAARASTGPNDQPRAPRDRPPGTPPSTGRSTAPGPSPAAPPARSSAPRENRGTIRVFTSGGNTAGRAIPTALLSDPDHALITGLPRKSDAGHHPRRTPSPNSSTLHPRIDSTGTF